ncbi:PriCT-2 domain-containing protein [Bordetella bronchiseptica]|uniref:PriCT-2 domain-containing protein n=1 Tax=Bordetella bronchiseptica TaxID=518 RepID=UPI00067D2078|nr:PriCT-2 domain-containing protein [Bordetella bronchiseptica]
MSDIHAAIYCIPAHDREIWVEVGMAVKAAMGEDGFTLWDSWSQTSDRYQRAAARSVWRSIKPYGGITVSTLFKLARDNGYRGGDSFVAPVMSAVYASEQARKDAVKRQQDAEKAAKKAAKILSECELEVHPYFAAKGFPELLVNVWEDGLAVVPMRRHGALVGCQLINSVGEKKFLKGQRSSGAEFVIGQSGKHILCEGYATALSAQVVLRNLKVPYALHVAFSAGNMKKIAHGLPGGIVLADNDASGTGERVAREIGWPYWMSDLVGEDFNDAHQRLGTFALSMDIGGLLRRRT